MYLLLHNVTVLQELLNVGYKVMLKYNTLNTSITNTTNSMGIFQNCLFVTM